MRGLLTTVIVMILGGVVAQGHHSISAVYDRARPVTLDATLVEFAMVQPPFPSAEDSRLSVSARSMPASSTILSRPPWPETSVIARSGSASARASRRTAASFAAPRSGGAVTRSFHASPYRPAMPSLRAPGTTRNRSRVEGAVTLGF